MVDVKIIKHKHKQQIYLLVAKIHFRGKSIDKIKVYYKVQGYPFAFIERYILDGRELYRNRWVSYG